MSSETPEERARRTREYLIDRAGADPGLTPAERETTIGFAVDQDAARVHTAEASLVRRLLAHRDAEVRRVGVFDGDHYRTLSFAEALEETADEDRVVRLKASVPLRYLTIGTGGRQTDAHAPVVSNGVFDE